MSARHPRKSFPTSQEPRHGLNGALEFLTRVLPHRSITVILSDFLGQTAPTRPDIDTHLRRKAILSETLGQASFTALPPSQPQA